MLCISTFHTLFTNVKFMLCADFWRPYVVGTATYFDCDVTAQQPNGYAVNNDDGLPQDEAAESRYDDEVEAAVAALRNMKQVIIV